jgi:hypothetical protein
MSTQCLHYIHPLSPFLYLLPPLTITSPSPSRQDLFPPSVLWFCIRKKEEENDIFACLISLYQVLGIITKIHLVKDSLPFRGLKTCLLKDSRLRIIATLPFWVLFWVFRRQIHFWKYPF